MSDYDRSIHSNPDAMAWADLFDATFPAGSPVPDKSTMLGWFANAMMAMHDAGAVRRPPLTEAREIAARCWCRPETSGIVMEPRLAEAFAQVLAFGEPPPPVLRREGERTGIRREGGKPEGEFIEKEDSKQ